MIDLGKWAFGHSKLVYFLLAVLLVGGLKSAYDMGKLEDPEVKVKIAMVVGVRPGASAHEMELEVTDPLEKAIRTVGEVDNTQSWSYNDLCIIQVELKSTTPDDRLEQCWDMLRHKVSDAEASLPGGTSVTVQDDFSLVYGMFYALTAEGFSERQLADYAGLIQRELTDLDGVARVELYGKREESIDISLRADRMATLGISPTEVLATLNGQNGTFYAGYYDNGDQRVRVTVTDKSRTVEQIRNMVIQETLQWMAERQRCADAQRTSATSVESISPENSAAAKNAKVESTAPAVPAQPKSDRAASTTSEDTDSADAAASKDAAPPVGEMTPTHSQPSGQAGQTAPTGAEYHAPTVGETVVRILHHMSRIFEDNSKIDEIHRGLQIDRKRRQELQRKRLAMGHKPDDHEEQTFR